MLGKKGNLSTFMPWPTARRAVPIAAVVLPLPGPVFTMINPRRMSAMLANAATLQQLSMDQMNQLATSVVRAKVLSSSADFSASTGSPMIYTHYTLAVSEVWKGLAATEVSLPGGDVNGLKQSFPGVPELRVGGGIG